MITVSILIVNYHVTEEILACIRSIIKSRPKTKYEIIVVDNDEVKTLGKELKKHFPEVTYIQNINRGYGHGNNVAAKKAKGKFLLVLNPDTKFLNNAIDFLVEFLQKDKKTGIVAPLLYDKENKIYPLQGAEELTPKSAIFSFSILSKLFPNNKVLNNYWLKDWNKKTPKEVKAVPGTAFLIRKDVFKKLGGFDEQFFLYFEELDICKRVSELGLKIFMYPRAKIYHAWAKSTDRSKLNTKKIFLHSRFLYLKKHFGVYKALATETFLRINKYKLLFGAVLLYAVIVATYRLQELMPFISDQGWYYTSARDSIINRTFPLVGIPSSHPWLHQGAYWTYILVPLLSLANFNPLAGAYFSVLLHLITICLLYYVATKVFSERIGLIAGILYACSPLIIIQARMAYHTTPIPFLTILFIYFVIMLIKGKSNYFPIIIFLLALLYNFEIATFLLTIGLILILLYGYIKKKTWFQEIFTLKIVILSVASFIIAMLPMLIYDFTHGFPQTVLFLAWIVYKIINVLGGIFNGHQSTTNIGNVLFFLAESYKKLVYWQSSLVAFTLGVFSFGFLFSNILEQIKRKSFQTGTVVITLILVISIVGIIVTSATSEAYLPVLFPIIALTLALFFDKLMVKSPRSLPVIVVILLIIVVQNTYSLIKENYFITKGVQYSDMLVTAKKIISDSDGRRYNLIGKGIGSEYQSFTMNYAYLTWWMGNAPSSSEVSLRYFIEETPKGIILTKGNKRL